MANGRANFREKLVENHALMYLKQTLHYFFIPLHNITFTIYKMKIE